MRGVFEIGFQVRRLVEEHPKKEPAVEVAIDANFVESMVISFRNDSLPLVAFRLWPAVVAQFRHPLTGDMEVDFVEVQIAIHPLHRLGRQVIGKYAAIFLFVGHQNEGQSQCERLCLCILTLLPQAPQTRLATSSTAITRKIRFCFISAITAKRIIYCE